MSNINFADVILDLSYGDCGKGKVTYDLCRRVGYTHVMRFNGGPNAGHTIYHNGIKFVTHQVPTGVFHGAKCIIGPGCVVDVDKFISEISYLEEHGISTKGKVFISKNAHLITDKHLLIDQKDKHIGTTKQGVGPAYVDKFNRKGTRAEDLKHILKDYLIDIYEEFYKKGKEIDLLCEGAQGFYLDVDWGDYPYVTSSGCNIGTVISNGVPFNKIRNVYGVCKAYDTYVGGKVFQDANDNRLNKIRELGQEYGATTGRPRQCNWLNLNAIKKAADINQITHLIVNKIDVLDTLGEYAILDEHSVEEMNREDFVYKIKSSFPEMEEQGNITFSTNPYRI